MAPVKTRSTSSRHRNDRGYKADPEDTNDDDDFYGMRELKHQLAGMNLQLKDTMGDGNCLFRACADQFTGSEREHAALRAEVCRYIEDHEEHFKSFLDNETVAAHVAQMRKNGTYGGNIELVAFARMKRVDIKVYQPGYIFVIEGIDVKKEGSSPGQRPVMHIAYHSWEHYSSIRNIDGPHEGPPEINPRPIKQTPLAKLTSKDPPRSIERMIMEVSGVQDLELVRELLESYRGDVDSVYNDLDQRLQESGIEGVIDTADHQDPKENSPTDQSLSLNEQSQQGGQDKDKNNNTGSENGKKDSDGPLSGTRDQLCPRISTDARPTPPASPQPSSRAATPVSVAPQASSPETSTDSGSVKDQRVPSPLVEPAKGIVPKKRISKEKKELAKRNQKLNRKNKGKTGSDFKNSGDHDSSSSSSSGSNKLADPSAGSDAGQRSMRELFV
ncbi:hypothetical protein BGZ70_009713 [Mortierella alpina]|uniref:OTU domain-containing protein n=1 Tax=Mortierella alpina TaxID=64518 RepID=A0A9P6J0W2_MORAP|nr:hypothetical protein BGZ70_009713 [Mortierella alpina]